MRHKLQGQKHLQKTLIFKIEIDVRMSLPMETKRVVKIRVWAPLNLRATSRVRDTILLALGVDEAKLKR